MIGTDTHHYQVVWYPIDIADQIGLTGPDKVVGGIYAAMVRTGRPPAEIDEVIRFRAPAQAEITGLRTSPTSMLAVIDRVTRDRAARAVELLRVTVPTDRVELLYDRLPIGETS